MLQLKQITSPGRRPKTSKGSNRFLGLDSSQEQLQNFELTHSTGINPGQLLFSPSRMRYRQSKHREREQNQLRLKSQKLKSEIKFQGVKRPIEKPQKSEQELKVTNRIVFQSHKPSVLKTLITTQNDDKDYIKEIESLIQPVESKSNSRLTIETMITSRKHRQINSIQTSTSKFQPQVIDKILVALASKSEQKQQFDPLNDQKSQILEKELNQILYTCDRVCKPRDLKSINLSYEHPVKISNLSSQNYKYYQIPIENIQQMFPIQFEILDQLNLKVRFFMSVNNFEPNSKNYQKCSDQKNFTFAIKDYFANDHGVCNYSTIELQNMAKISKVKPYLYISLICEKEPSNDAHFYIQCQNNIQIQKKKIKEIKKKISTIRITEESENQNKEIVKNLQKYYQKETRKSRQTPISKIYFTSQDRLSSALQNRIRSEEKQREKNMQNLKKWDVYRREKQVREFLNQKYRVRKQNIKEMVLQIKTYAILKKLVENMIITVKNHKRQMVLLFVKLRCRQRFKFKIQKKFGPDFHFRMKNQLRRVFTFQANNMIEYSQTKALDKIHWFLQQNHQSAILRDKCRLFFFKAQQIKSHYKIIKNLRNFRKDFAQRIFNDELNFIKNQCHRLLDKKKLNKKTQQTVQDYLKKLQDINLNQLDIAKQKYMLLKGYIYMTLYHYWRVFLLQSIISFLEKEQLTVLDYLPQQLEYSNMRMKEFEQKTQSLNQELFFEKFDIQILKIREQKKFQKKICSHVKSVQAILKRVGIVDVKEEVEVEVEEEKHDHQHSEAQIEYTVQKKAKKDIKKSDGLLCQTQAFRKVKMAQGDAITRKMNKKLMRKTTKYVNEKILQTAKSFFLPPKSSIVLPWVAQFLGISEEKQFIDLISAIVDTQSFNSITAIHSMGFPSFNFQPKTDEVKFLILNTVGIFDFDETVGNTTSCSEK